MKNRLFTTFWQGKELNPISYTSLKSFIDCGHRLQLFTYGEIENVPPGVSIRDASDILPEYEIKDFEGWFAGFADLFRYAFLYKEGGFWVDADVICLREEAPAEEIYMAYETYNHSSIGNSGLALPKGNEFAKALFNYAYDPGLVTPWDGDRTNHRLWLSRSFYSLSERRKNAGGYDFFGPPLLTEAARYYNYLRFTKPYTDMYSIGWGSWRNLFFNPYTSLESMDFINSWAAHCWGSVSNGACEEILESGIGPLSEMIRNDRKMRGQ